MVRPRAWPLRNPSAKAKFAHSAEPVPEQQATTWACVLGVYGNLYPGPILGPR